MNTTPLIHKGGGDSYHRLLQLDNLLGKANSIHYMLLIGDSSCTEFLVDDIDLPSSSEILREKSGKPLYYYYDEMIEAQNPRTVKLEDQMLYSFGPLCFHRGEGAIKIGRRYFIRITYSNHYVPMNELRYQTQVYTKERVSW